MKTIKFKEALGKTREEVVELLGRPHAKGCTSRKYKTPSCYKYGYTELFFEPWKTGRCTMVFDSRLEVHKVLYEL